MTDRPTPPPPYDIAVWEFPSGQRWIGFRCRGGSYSWFTPEEAWRVTEDIRARLVVECGLKEARVAAVLKLP